VNEGSYDDAVVTAAAGFIESVMTLLFVLCFDAEALDLPPLHVSSDEMDPEDFRKSFGLR